VRFEHCRATRTDRRRVQVRNTRDHNGVGGEPEVFGHRGRDRCDGAADLAVAAEAFAGSIPDDFQELLVVLVAGEHPIVGQPTGQARGVGRGRDAGNRIVR